MIRVAFVIFLIAVLAVAFVALGGDAGEAHLIWRGWRVDMTAAAAALLVLFVSLLATIFWGGVKWILEAPRRAAKARAETRRKQGAEVLARGFLAAAAGDGSEARRLAQKAADLADDSPALVRVLAAQAAEAAGDLPAAKAAYSAMLGFPEMRLAGLKGLMQTAQADGDRDAALGHAQSAYGLAKTARWAWRALLEARLEAGDWAAALDLVAGAQDRKIVSPIVADRTRAALLAASAASFETSPDERLRDQAEAYALQAVKLKPDFAPGAVMAARLLADNGKAGKASSLIETAWKSAPHPALWLAYRDLKTRETPRERSRRLAALAALNPDARESRILNIEQALIGGDVSAARAGAKALESEPLTRRLAGLQARAANAAGAIDEARAWVARGVGAPQEPDWSDLDPEGRAFAYQPADWARLVVSFAESGELIHPRHERRERTMSELPELPISYADSAALLAGHEAAPAPYDIADGVYEDDEPPPPPAPRGGERRPSGRRRLASAPRVAK